MHHCAFIAIGSNLNSPHDQCAKAVRLIGAIKQTDFKQVSSFYQTEPLVLDQTQKNIPWYVNAVCEIATNLDPKVLFDELTGIEREMGRTRNKKWESRIIDLDLLSYDNLVECWVETGHALSLQLPHPQMQNRSFVLKPLGEIAPNWVHPVLHKTVMEMLNELH